MNNQGTDLYPEMELTVSSLRERTKYLTQLNTEMELRSGHSLFLLKSIVLIDKVSFDSK